MVPDESGAIASKLDFVEDLSDDVLSRVVLHCCARDALCFAASSRSALAASDVMAHRLFMQTFGTSDLPATLTTTQSRAKIFNRLDRARPNAQFPEHLRETFSWAAGHGYCSFLVQAAARQSWDGRPSPHLLNGRPNSEGIPPPLWRAAKRHQAAAVTLLLELRADPEPWFVMVCLDLPRFALCPCSHFTPGRCIRLDQLLVEIVLKLCDACLIKVVKPQECAGKGGTTALFWSARHGDVPSVRALLKAGASPLHGSVTVSEPSRGLPRYPGGECALSAALQAWNGSGLVVQFCIEE